MKFFVHCTKTVDCTFVVDADTAEQADKKLSAGEYEYKREWTTTQDSYLGYEYVTDEKFSGTGDGAVICSVEDLCRELGTTKDDLKRYLYKNTECGMQVSWDDDGVTLVGYVEGADCDSPSDTLLFPFTMGVFDDTVATLEVEADELWHEWNDDEAEGE